MFSGSVRQCSPQEAVESASVWNAVLAVGEAVTAALTGNIGFMNEAAHNLADAISFYAKRKAMDTEKIASYRLRRIAAGVLASGSLVAFGGAAFHAAEGENEDASDIPIAVALLAAGVNTKVALKVHSAEHEVADEIVKHVHGDSKLHTFTDASTGWLYADGLLAERYVPGSANYVVMLTGTFATTAAGMMMVNIHKQQNANA